MNILEIEQKIKEHMKKCRTDRVKLIYFTHEEWNFYPKDGTLLWSTPDLPYPTQLNEFDLIYCPKCGEIIYSCCKEIIGKNIKEAWFPINMIIKCEPLKDEE